MPDSEIAAELKRALRHLQIVTVVLFLAILGAASWYAVDSSRARARLHADQARTAQAQAITNSALCALRSGLEKRVKASEEFLRTHPHGIAGISAASIQADIDGQNDTVASLSILAC